MSVRREVSGISRKRQTRRFALAVGAALAMVAALGAGTASAAGVPTHEFVQDVGPIGVDGYAVKQSFALAPDPNINGYVTKMEVDVVDPDGTPVPIQRLMLHHIVFANLAHHDETCDSITGFDGVVNPGLAAERFYAAGEERAKMNLPEGYGYQVKASDNWGLLYMFMNHQPVPDQALVRYKVTYVTDADLAAAGESMNAVKPYWMDVNNCRADPIYNVPGNGGPGSTQTRSYDFTMPVSGHIVAGGGHVHGGAEMLTLTEPDCGNRELARSLPTWGNPDHPFYNVRPILHEPGPTNMTAFGTQQGFPIAAGQRLELNSIYDDSLPHTRVMGIEIAYVDPDDAADPSDDVTDGCGPMPTDVQITGTDQPGRTGGFIRYTIPLTGLDENGNAVTIKNPPGKLRPVPSGTELIVGDHFFLDKNVRIKKGATLKWRFASEDLHNVTLANGPIGIGSDNLNDDREFTQRFNKKGTYRFFCALHPVEMTERVVVVGKHGRRAHRHARS